jgi:hypothetical protein
MTAFPGSPRHLRGALVSIDPETEQPQVIMFQYNPYTLTRSLEAQTGEGGGVEALRVYGAPVETIKLEAELDATDALGEGDANAAQMGVYAVLSALETLVYPRSDDVISNTELLQSGAMEIIPPQGPLTVFVWGRKRVLPVQVTEFSITEEAYDVNLNPIRAKVALGLRVLSYNDLPSSHKGHSLFLAHQVAKESMASKGRTGSMDAIGNPKL